jgi:branched-chain amino acid transport system ATP-binding protein
VLVIEQNVALALALSDVAYVLETGRVVTSGNSTDLAQDDRVRQAYLGGHAGG